MDLAESTARENSSSIGSIVMLIDKALRTYGVDPEPLFEKTGIDFKEAALDRTEQTIELVLYDLDKLPAYPDNVTSQEFRNHAGV